MGYYDQTDRKKSGSRPGIFGFIGAVLGGLLVVFAIPVLSDSGFLPYDVSPSGSGENTEETSEQEAEQEIESVSLETTSDVTEAVDRVSDAVVGIVNMNVGGTGAFGGPEGGGEGTGSGIIYKIEEDRAFVVTNQHVIDGAAEGNTDVDVTMTDGSRVPAEFVGEDVLTDLAVLTIDAEGIETIADFGNSGTLRSGEPAIAIGNPLAFEGSVTLGIISATERSIPVDLSGNGQPDWEAEVLQTDAAINPGNSGGALVNIQGEVVGINSMKIAQQAVEGIGFSIPTEIAMPVIEDLEQYGEVQRPQMGIALRSLQEIPSDHWQNTLGLPEDVKGGVYVEGVEPGSPAEEGGLQEDDVIVELEDTEISDAHDLRRFLYSEVGIGDEMEVTFYRDGELQTTSIVLAEEVF
ncbi:S1C family serine protease [Alkalicoccus halolimnae]|uniref:Trypsin-like peptidase domain-containing protein n=1 Tax=Alkalicoccus halolimnae TaxID=1667239 RepID=A0A5C7F7W3_9BACI|nr:trypsin-like peptidase domain-containing protein [Alkalicoccus halolimnae]TXF86761.1 PDZ domain-containing protein [Alkalicoccus halolimnae]